MIRSDDEYRVASDLLEEHGFARSATILRAFADNMPVLEQDAAAFFKDYTRCRKAILRLVEGKEKPLKVKDLLFVTPEELLDLRGCGFTTLMCIRAKLGEHGLRLKGDK